MGLAERRAVEQFRTGQYPEWQERIETAAGFPVPVEVVWDELAVDGYAGSYAEFFPKVYFEPLVAALTAVTVDQMGVDAARAGLTKIVVRNSAGYSSTNGFTFTDGVLTVDHRPESNVDYGEDRAKGLQEILERGL
jgi:hypothetical protein